MKKAMGCFAVCVAFVYFAVCCFAMTVALVYFAAWASAHWPAWWAFPSVLIGVFAAMGFVIAGVICVVRYFNGD